MRESIWFFNQDAVSCNVYSCCSVRSKNDWNILFLLHTAESGNFQRNIQPLPGQWAPDSYYARCETKESSPWIRWTHLVWSIILFSGMTSVQWTSGYRNVNSGGTLIRISEQQLKHNNGMNTLTLCQCAIVWLAHAHVWLSPFAVRYPAIRLDGYGHGIDNENDFKFIAKSASTLWFHLRWNELANAFHLHELYNSMWRHEWNRIRIEPKTMNDVIRL